MRKVSQIIGINILFALLFLFLIGMLLFASIFCYRTCSFCSSLSADACVIEGRIVDCVRRTGDRGRIVPSYKVEYRNKSGNKEFFCDGDSDCFDGKEIGDAVTFKVDGDKILLATPDDVIIFLAMCAGSAILFLLFCACGLFALGNRENEKFRGMKKVTLLLFRVLMLCGAVEFFLFSLQRLKGEFFPEKIESALVLSVDILRPERDGTGGQLINAKSSIDGRKVTIIESFNPAKSIVSTGQEVDIFLSEKNSPRIAGNLSDKTFAISCFICSLFLILFTFLAIVRKVKTDKDDEEEVDEHSYQLFRDMSYKYVKVPPPWLPFCNFNDNHPISEKMDS